MLRRRRALVWLAGAGAAPLLGCGGGSDAGSTAGNSGGGFSAGTCSVIPEETAGPFPGDGSNTANGTIANALALSGIVRSDIRGSIAGATGVAGGVPLTIQLDLVNTNGSCADLAGYAIYLWHCDREGRYSMYSSGVTAENYLRGVQETNANGLASFTTVFPGCYAGRMPHMHFEVYRSLATATASTSKIKTSQIAFPVAACQAVYATTGYSASVANLAQISFASDNVFSDGTSLQLATISGDVTNGYVATLQVGISA
jgi:protocatechuate 3,4-dioxygenase beta subunit